MFDRPFYGLQQEDEIIEEKYKVKIQKLDWLRVKNRSSDIMFD